MSLRFAIIKVIRTLVGQHEEDVVFEWSEDQINEKLSDFMRRSLPRKKDPIFGEVTWSQSEIMSAFETAWTRTLQDFKKVTIRIL
jgi:hypothetical protein